MLGSRGLSIFWLSLAHVYVCLIGINSERVTLLNTSSDGFTGFTMKNVLGQTINGWKISRLNDGTEFYEVCDAVPNVDNNLLTPVFDTGGAEVIDIDVRFIIYKCDGLSHCNEELEMYYIKENDVEGTKMYRFKKYNSTERNKLSKKGAPSPVIISDRSFVTKFDNKNLKILFKDKGGCKGIVSVIVYAYRCNQLRFNLAIFPQAWSPYAPQRNVAATGCVENAEKKGYLPEAQCTSLGEWTETEHQLCECNAGFEPDNKQEQCHPCRDMFYKPFRGNHLCMHCPMNSYHKDGKECNCKNGYYRGEGENITLPCAQTPSAVRNARNSVFGSFVTLEWDAPKNDGGRHVVFYRVTCDECESSPHYSVENANRFYERTVDISGLKANKNYTFNIYSLNAVSHLTQPRPVKVLFTTGPATNVRNLRVSDMHNRIRLDWDPPANVHPDVYYVSVYFKNNLHMVQEVKDRTFYEMARPGPGLYTFLVSTTRNIDDNSERRTYRIPNSLSDNQNQMKEITFTLAIILTVCLILSVVCLAAVCCYRRKPYEGIATDQLYETTNRYEVKVPIGQQFMDPSMYDNVTNLLCDFTKEIDGNMITMQQAEPDLYSSGGSFGAPLLTGTVNSGYDDNFLVSVKTATPGDQCAKFKKTILIHEAAICAQFSHPNVILLHGIVNCPITNEPISAVYEYAQNGPLDAFLRESPKKSPVLQLVHMLRGVACGMHYLSDLGFTHKVLKGSNILVSSNHVCKISGFDMRAALDAESQYEDRSADGKIWSSVLPWLAPEVISMSKFSAPSDVWAFGVLMWEVVSLGDKPFFEWTPDEIAKAVENGCRLQCPNPCPQILFDMMLRCWLTDRNRRPCFSLLREELENIIRSPSSLGPQASLRTTLTRRQPSTSSMNFSDCTDYSSTGTYCGRVFTASELLHHLKLSQYKDKFNSVGIHLLEDLFHADDHVLREIGVSSSKHRRKILGCVDVIRQQRFVNNKYSTLSKSPAVHIL